MPKFFDKNFPGVTNLIAKEDLIKSFETNPHLPLISIKCKPYHFGSTGVIVGDAAHAMVPFYGQGMNAGMEDIRVLFEILDTHELRAETARSLPVVPSAPPLHRAQALADYSSCRAPDLYAINDLALQNYVEMRSSVLSKQYRLRKYLEELISVRLPNMGWHTKYFRVSFSNEGYKDVVQRSEYQGRVLVRSFLALLAGPVVAMGAVMGYRYRTVFKSIWTGIQAGRQVMPS